MSAAPQPDTDVAPDDEAAAILERSGVLRSDHELPLAAIAAEVRAELRAMAAAISFHGPDGTVVKCLATEAGDADTPQPAGKESVRSCLERAFGGADLSYLEAPVTVEGQVVGLVSVLAAGARAWPDRDLRALHAAAGAVANELTLRVFREETVRIRELVASHTRVHDLIARAAPLPEILTEIVRSIERHDPSVIGCVVLLDAETSTLHPGAGPSLPPEYLSAIDGVVIGPNIGTCGSAAWSGQLTITEDMAEDPRWAPIREFAMGFGLRHCWSMPIKAPGGLVLGTLAFYGGRPRRPLPEHLDLLADWARVAGIAIERHRGLERLTHDARFDTLTGLPNRASVFETLEKAIERAQDGLPVAVMFVDLDGLKQLNDTYGHDRADEMLREVADRLSATVRAEDFVGRMGGDEFLVIAEQVASTEFAGKLGLRLLESVSRPLAGLESVVVTASIGITLVHGGGVDAREAIREADSAMYEAKRSGRDRCVFYQGSQPVRVGRRLQLERELRGVERRGELSLVFQPVFSIRSGEIVAVESLLRWESPKLGSVSPVEFIPVAEDTGAIVPIGAWVLRESCEALAAVIERIGRPLELSVNVSARQISNPGFALSVQQTVAHAELPPGLLTLELTESALVRPDGATARTLRELDELDIRIALDDFGTGFSSLSWLKEHPLQALKIDGGFVAGLASDPRDEAIVAAVLGLGRALGCTITAEAIESTEQLEALRALGCERGQGFLLAHPMPLDELLDLLGEQPAARAA